MPSLYCKAWVMALGKIPAVWRQHRYPSPLRYQLSVLGISGEKQKKGWLQYSVGDAASYLAGTESFFFFFFGSVSPHCCPLVHRTDWGSIIFPLEFFFLLFFLLLNQDCIVEKGKGFPRAFLDHEMVDVSCEHCS